MKKIYTNLAMLLIMSITLTTLTACDWWDEDEEIAYTLEGTWRGYMKIRSNYGGRTYETVESEITFLKDPYRYSSGDGYWVDYYSDSPWGEYVANHISWTVNLSDIDIYFREDGTRFTIRDYRLDRDRFTGTLYDNGQRVDFTLYRTSRRYSNYDHWGYGYYDDYYWSRTTRSVNGDSAVVEKPVRYIGE